MLEADKGRFLVRQCVFLRQEVTLSALLEQLYQTTYANTREAGGLPSMQDPFHCTTTNAWRSNRSRSVVLVPTGLDSGQYQSAQVGRLPVQHR
jgi:hypothetical protein